MLTFNSPFDPNSVSLPNYRTLRIILVVVSYQLYAKDSSRGELAMKPRNGPHGEGGSGGPYLGHLIRWPVSGTSYGNATAPGRSCSSSISHLLSPFSCIYCPLLIFLLLFIYNDKAKEKLHSVSEGEKRH
jgi:hypothetical protein